MINWSRLPRIQETMRSILLAVGAIFAISAVTGYFLVLGGASYNVPIHDDYDTLLKATTRFESEPAWNRRLAILFDQHNEHRIVVLRVLALLDYALGGQLNFIALNVLGNFALVGIAWLVIRVIRETDAPTMPLYIVGTVLLLFNPQYSDGMIWATSSVSNFVAILLSFGAIYSCLNTTTTTQAAGLACLVLAPFTQGYGLLVPPICLAMQALQRRWNLMALWGGVAVATYALFFFGYERYDGVPKPHGSITDIVENFVRYLTAFIGGSPGLGIKSLSEVLGAILLLTPIACLVRDRRPSTGFWFLAFLFGCALLNTYGRFGLGSDYATWAHRYRIFSALFVCCAIPLLAQCVSGRCRTLLGYVFASWAVITCGFYFLVSTPSVVSMGVRAYVGATQWQLAGSGLLYPSQDLAGDILRRAAELDVFAFPALQYNPLLSQPMQRGVPQLSPPQPHSIDIYVQNSEFTLIEGWAARERRPDPGQSVELVLMTHDDARAVKSFPVLRTDVASVIKGSPFGRWGFVALVPRAQLASSSDRLALCIKDSAGEICFGSNRPNAVMENEKVT